MRQFFLILTLMMLVVPQTQTAFAAMAITGTITEKQGDSVKVKFKPHKIVGPKIGDKVEFPTEIKGIKAKAGTGKVTKVDGEAVWVKITKGRPNLKMKAIIQATGAPLAVSKDLRAGSLQGKEAERSNQKKSLEQEDALTNKSPQIKSILPDSSKAGVKVKSESVQKLRNDKLYAKKDSRFYHSYWCKEIAGIDYDSLIMFGSVDDAKESGGLPCKECDP